MYRTLQRTVPCVICRRRLDEQYAEIIAEGHRCTACAVQLSIVVHKRNSLERARLSFRRFVAVEVAISLLALAFLFLA